VLRALTAIAVTYVAFAGSAAAPQPTVFVSPNGSHAGRCTRGQPCSSWDRAYRVAKPGDVIELAGGTYPTQTIGVDASKVKATADVTFQPAAGATVTINGDLDMKGSHAVFKSINLRFLSSDAVRGPTTSNHVTFVGFHGRAFLIGPNSYITIKGGDWGPNTGPNTEEDKVGPDGTIRGQWPTNIVLDGLYVHDQNSNDLSSQHMGGLFIISGGPITLENSHFARDVVYDVQVQDFTNPDCCGMTFGPAHDVVIENNWFGQAVTGLNDPGGDGADDNQPELQLDPRGGKCWQNWLIRFNSFARGPALGFDADPCFNNVRVVGNVGQHPGLQCFYGAAGLTWAYNAWLNGQCGSTDAALTTLPYANATLGHEDFDLTGGPALGLVTATGGDYELATDIQARPRPGGARDAGADQS
jgi:hypothetical protein